jgi:hypothetical protein
VASGRLFAPLIKPLMTPNLSVRIGLAFEGETEALVARFSNAPTGDRKLLINTTMKSLKRETILQSFDCLWFIAGSDAQSSHQNWIADKHNLTPVGSPTFTPDRGYAGNGSSSYLRTNYTPSTDGVNYKLNDASGWVWSRTSTAEDTPLMGNTTNPRFSITPRAVSNNGLFRINDANSLTTANSDGSGLFGVSRSGATTKKAWRNGSQLGTTSTEVSTALPAQELYLCGVNTPNYATKQVAFAAFGASLNGLESKLYAIVSAYLTEVGAA